MVDPPKRTGQTPAGTPTFGPSGAGVWSRPTVDAARGRLYITTGDNYSHPATTTSDAVMALDIKTGHIVWSRQMTPSDVYNSACGAKAVNCPANNGPDYDFGSSAILVRGSGRERDSRRRTEIRRRLCARSGPERKAALAGTRWKGQRQWRCAVGNGERWAERLCGGIRCRTVAAAARIRRRRIASRRPGWKRHTIARSGRRTDCA